MPVEYYCEKCDYKTNRKSSYTRHNKSNKHLYGVSKKTNNIDTIIALSPKNQVCTQKTLKKCDFSDIALLEQNKNENIVCEYCNKKIRYKKNITQHYKSCKIRNIKLEYDNKIKQILDDKDKQIDELVHEKDQQIHDLLIEQKTHEKIINQLSRNQNTQNNLVINNYYESSSLLDDIKKIKYDIGPDDCKTMQHLSNTLYSFIYDNCIHNIPQNKRSIHCLDPSRNKFVYRDDNLWIKDIKGTQIFRQLFNGVYNYIEKSDRTKLEKNLLNVQVLTVESEQYLRKLRSRLKEDTLIQNMIEE